MNTLTPGTPPLVNRRTEPLAIAGLVLAGLGFVVGPLSLLPGIVCGHVARARCRRDRSLDGEGMALAALIVGYVGLALMVVLMLFVGGLVLLSNERAVDFDFQSGGGSFNWQFGSGNSG